MLQRKRALAIAGCCVVALAAADAAAQMTGVELVPNNGVSGILFGTSVGISGDIAAVGAAADNGSRGSVTVFARSGSAWPYQTTLTAAEGIVGDQLGYYTEAYGTQVFAGSPHHGPAAGPYPGAVFVFTPNGSNWAETQMLEATPAVSGGFFGARFAVDGTTLLITGTNASAQKVVYIFTNTGGGHWTQTGTLQPSEGGDFGSHVSISGNVAVVG